MRGVDYEETREERQDKTHIKNRMNSHHLKATSTLGMNVAKIKRKLRAFSTTTYADTTKENYI